MDIFLWWNAIDTNVNDTLAAALHHGSLCGFDGHLFDVFTGSIEWDLNVVGTPSSRIITAR